MSPTQIGNQTNLTLTEVFPQENYFKLFKLKDQEIKSKL